MIAPCLRLARNAACYPCWMGSLSARLGQPPAEVAPLGFGGGELERLAVGGRRRSVWPSTEGSAARSRPTNTRTTAKTRMNRTPPRIWPNLPSAGAVFPGNPPRITHSVPRRRSARPIHGSLDLCTGTSRSSRHRYLHPSRLTLIAPQTAQPDRGAKLRHLASRPTKVRASSSSLSLEVPSRAVWCPPRSDRCRSRTRTGARCGPVPGS